MAERSSEDLLIAWGIAYGEEGLAVHHRRRISRLTYHPIAEGMQFAPGKRPTRTTKALLNRDGRSRRRYMAVKAGLPGLIGMEFVDPVRGKQTNTGGSTEVGRAVPPELARVEKAARVLEGIHLLRALCLRANYCVKGDQSEKLDWVTSRFRQASKHAEPVKLKRFRDEVAHARVFVLGFLAGMEKVA